MNVISITNNKEQYKNSPDEIFHESVTEDYGLIQSKICTV